MAEFAKQRITRSVQELIDMAKIDLFSSAELTKINEARTEFENKLRHSKVRELYDEYVKYEVELMERVSRIPCRVDIRDKKSNVEYSIANRIDLIYQEGSRRFGECGDFWRAYIDFGKKIGYRAVVERAIGDMLENRAGDPSAWAEAAEWHFERGDGAERARKLLIRGLRRNPADPTLYAEAFALELRAANTGGDVSACIARARVIFESALGDVRDTTNLEFALSLLRVAEGYDFTEEFQCDIIGLLFEKYPLSEDVWHAVAQRDLQVRRYEKNGTDCGPSAAERLTNCIEVYDRAVEQLGTEKMWRHFLETVLHQPEATDEVKLETLTKAYEASESAGKCLMSDDHYLALAELSPTEKRETVLRIATERLPNSISLWRERVAERIGNDDDQGVETAFRAGIEALKDRAAPLWRLYILYLTVAAVEGEVDRITAAYEEAIASPHASITEAIAPRYLEWVISRIGVESARETYLRLAKPYAPLVLHSTMFELESTHPRPNIEVLRSILKCACEQHGATDCGVWLDRIELEMKHDPSQVTNVYEEALATLEESLVSVFKVQYELIAREAGTVD